MCSAEKIILCKRQFNTNILTDLISDTDLANYHFTLGATTLYDTEIAPIGFSKDNDFYLYQ